MVAIPNDIFDRILTEGFLSPEQATILERHPQIARDLLRKIPRLQTVAEIVYRQGSMSSIPVSGDRAVMIGASILSAALDFEELVSLGASPQQALAALRSEGRKYHRRVLDALATAAIFTGKTDVRIVPLFQLRVGMILDEEVRSARDALLVTRGEAISEGSLQRLRNYAALKLLAKTEFRVQMPQQMDGLPEVSAA